MDKKVQELNPDESLSEEVWEDASCDASHNLESNIYEELSAYLFVSPKPLSIERITELTGFSDEEIRKKIDSINSALGEANLGFEIIEIQNSFQMRTRLSVKKALQKLITPKMKRLSKAAAETLAVIAYKQPVSKAEIEVIRGVDPVPTLRTLLDGKLIRIVGREDTPGSPALYGTTDHFLERFGLKSLSELPTIRELDLFDQAEDSGESPEYEDVPDESSDESDVEQFAAEDDEVQDQRLTH